MFPQDQTKGKLVVWTNEGRYKDEPKVPKKRPRGEGWMGFTIQRKGVTIRQTSVETGKSK